MLLCVLDCTDGTTDDLEGVARGILGFAYSASLGLRGLMPFGIANPPVTILSPVPQIYLHRLIV